MYRGTLESSHIGRGLHLCRSAGRMANLLNARLTHQAIEYDLGGKVRETFPWKCCSLQTVSQATFYQSVSPQTSPIFDWLLANLLTRIIRIKFVTRPRWLLIRLDTFECFIWWQATWFGNGRMAVSSSVSSRRRVSKMIEWEKMRNAAGCGGSGFLLWLLAWQTDKAQQMMVMKSRLSCESGTILFPVTNCCLINHRSGEYFLHVVPTSYFNNPQFLYNNIVDNGVPEIPLAKTILQVNFII